MQKQFKVGDKVRVCPKHNAAWAGVDMSVVEVAEGYIGVKHPKFGGGGFTTLSAISMAKKPRDYVADHARRTLRKAGLTAEEAANYVAVIAEGKATKQDGEGLAATFPLSAYSRKIPGKETLAETVFTQFSWARTPQGFDYWSDIYSRLVLV